MVRIQLPARFEAARLFPVIKEHFGTFEVKPSAVDFDFSRMNFVFPSGIVFLSNLALFLVRQGSKVTFSGMDAGNDSVRFLDESLFFQQHLVEKLRPTSKPRSTTMPLMELCHAECHGWIRTNLAP
jgi:hypothetical protein